MATQHVMELKAALLTAPMLWGTYFIMIYLYVVALAMTAGVVRQINAGQQPNIVSQIGFVQQMRSDALSVSAKIFGMMLVAMLLIGTVIVRSVDILGGLASASTIGLIAALLASLAIAFFITPAALRLIAGHQQLAISAKKTEDGRRFASVAVTASVVIGYFCAVAVNSIRPLSFGDHLIARTFTDAAGSLITALPYIPFFVCLSFMALDAGEPSIVPV